MALTPPRCGAMVLQLVAARTQLLRVLHRQRFGARSARSSRPRLRRAPPRRRSPWLVLRDLQGNELVSEREAAPPFLELTAAGKQAAERVARKRRR